uniref:Ig-like domain-containing protein n=1 Tax=Glossina palpalis gambiensis TaxID=67801 RepID=A0A1B0BRT4_9MUSC
MIVSAFFVETLQHCILCVQQKICVTFNPTPPSSIEIQGYSNNAKVEVRENQDLTLKCIVANSKPAAQIIWFRNNVEYKIVQFVNGQWRKRRMDEQADVLTRLKKTINMVESVTGPAKNDIDKRMYTYGAQTTRMHALLILCSNNRNDKVEEITPKRFTTTSNLKLKPTAADDYTEYTCQAKHKALAPDMPMRSIVQLSVLYPPGPPYIQGYTQGETLRRGQTVELICNSRGGNPPAQLIWYKNGSQIRMAYR